MEKERDKPLVEYKSANPEIVSIRVRHDLIAFLTFLPSTGNAWKWKTRSVSPNSILKYELNLPLEKKIAFARTFKKRNLDKNTFIPHLVPLESFLGGDG